MSLFGTKKFNQMLIAMPETTRLYVLQGGLFYDFGNMRLKKI